jgi:hypothetical protein
VLASESRAEVKLFASRSLREAAAPRDMNDRAREGLASWIEDAHVTRRNRFHARLK